jgi:hypothetical protein
MAACGALTVKGEPCKREAMQGADRCAVHLHPEQRGWASLLTPEVADRLVALLKAGNYDAVAARAAGVSERTLTHWLNRGKSSLPQDEPYRELRDRIVRARAEGEAVHVARVAQAAQEDWHASAWFLERSYPERWGRVSPRPFGIGREEPGPPGAGDVAPVPAPPGVFDELDDLAKQRAKRPAV